MCFTAQFQLYIIININIKILFLLAQKTLLRFVFFVLLFLNPLLLKLQICHLYIQAYIIHFPIIVCIFVSSLFIVCFVSVFHINIKNCPIIINVIYISSTHLSILSLSFSHTFILSLLCQHLHLTLSHFVMIWSHCHALHVYRCTFYVYALRNRKKKLT